jgi:hypothetical protein
MDTISTRIILADPKDSMNSYYIAVGKNMLKSLCMLDSESYGNKAIIVQNKSKQSVTVIARHSPEGYDSIIVLSPRGKGLYLIFIRDTSNEKDGYEYELVYDDNPDKKGKDYRALLYNFPEDMSNITANGYMPKGALTIGDTGLTLNAQSGNGVYAAELPSIFTYNDTIDNAEFSKSAWGSVRLLFNIQTRIVGTYYISNWLKGEKTAHWFILKIHLLF